MLRALGVGVLGFLGWGFNGSGLWIDSLEIPQDLYNPFVG